MSPTPKQAVILVGGVGSRLGELTRTIPKPLLPILGEPFLLHLIRRVANFGFTEVILLCGYRAERFESLTSESCGGTVNIRICVEPPSLLGTGGGLKHAAALLDPVFVLLNGDTWFDFNLLDLTCGFGGGSELGRIALRRQDAGNRYGSVTLDNGRIAQFGAETDGAGLINGGVYALSLELVEFLREGPSSLERDAFPSLARAGRLQGRIYDAPFLDIGVPADLDRAGSFLAATRLKPAVFLQAAAVLGGDGGGADRTNGSRWLAGAPEAIRLLNDRGYYVFVLTDPAGAEPEKCLSRDTAASLRLANEELRGQGAHIDAFERIASSAPGLIAADGSSSSFDEARSGPFRQLLQAWPVDRARSFFVAGQREGAAAAVAAAALGVGQGAKGNLCEVISQMVESSCSRRA